MKYKLISKTLEETICSKVVVDGIDYYVNDQKDKPFPHWCIQYSIDNITPTNLVKVIENGVLRRPIIATNDPNIDIPQVIDEVEKFAHKKFPDDGKHNNRDWQAQGFIKGYSKSQETHSFSEEDMIEFGEFCRHTIWEDLAQTERCFKNDGPPNELLKLWKEQQIKTIYYI